MNKAIYKYILFLLYATFFMTKEMLIFFDRGINYNSEKIIFTLFIYLGLLSWTLLIGLKGQALTLVILDFSVSLIYFSNMIYQRYYQQYLTLDLIPMMMVDQKELGESIISLIKPIDFLMFASIPLGATIYFIVKRFVKKKIMYRKSFVRINIVIVMAIFANMVFLYRAKEIENQDILVHTWEIKTIADSFGIPYYHYHDLKKIVINNWNKSHISEKDIQSLQEYFLGSTSSQKVSILREAEGELNGIARGRNLIMIQVEALQEFVINLSVAGQEVTPTLNALAREGIHFTNVYAQTAGGNTSDAEFMANNSLYAASTGAAYFTYADNNYNSLPIVLKNNGYSSAVAMHAGSKTYWNRNIAYKAFGFDNYYYNEYYSKDKTVGWGINDRDFFLENIDYMKGFTEPFYSFMVTVSSHYPFGAFKGENRVVMENKYEETQLDSYLEDIAFVDGAIATLLEELEKAGLYENSIIVIYGDHRGLRDDMNDVVTEFLDIENSPMKVIEELTKVPLIVYGPGLELNREVEALGGQIDIMPTILNLLGIDTPYMIGRDLINTKENLTVLRNGSFITSDYIYNGENDEGYNRESGEIVTKENIEESLDEAIRKLEISDKILKYDAIKTLEKIK